MAQVSSQTSRPISRRGHSSSGFSDTQGCSQIDPCDLAERGWCVNPAAVSASISTSNPRTNSLRSNNTTLTGSEEDTSQIDHRDLGLASLSGPNPSTQPATAAASSSSTLTSSVPNCDKATGVDQAAWQAGYDQFRHETHEKFPIGWPSVAAFIDSCDSFAVFRRFGRIQARLLAIHEGNLRELEDQLDTLDQKDEEAGDKMQWRLRSRYYRRIPIDEKKSLEDKIEDEINKYSTLLLNYHKTKLLPRTPVKDHDSVFRYLWGKKPLDTDEFAWIFQHQDFVSIIPPRRNIFENFIRKHLDARPNSFLKKFLKSERQQHQAIQDETIQVFSNARIALSARLIVVFFAVLVLFIPVLLFLLTAMSRGAMAVIVLTFVFIFSTMMSLMTEAGVPEIFVGTCTYCAVLVVFLGNLASVVA